MKLHLRRRWTTACLFMAVTCNSLVLFAQDKIEIDKEEIGSWFQHNWLWVAGGVLLLLLIVVLASGGNKSITRRKTTTVIKDPEGHTKSITTVEEQ